jgi:hypothetical protein
MRVVVGSDGSKNLKQAELERHLEAMSRFISAGENMPAPACTLVLRSAASAPAQALILMKDALRDAGIRAQAVLAKLEPQDELQQLFSALSALSAGADETTLIRWARNPRLLEAHEQVTYGAEMCWSGDAMRRDADKRNPLVLFETDAPLAAQRARHAFGKLWAASVSVPLHHLVAGESKKPSAAYDQPEGTPVTAMRPHVQGWPLVRH